MDERFLGFSVTTWIAFFTFGLVIVAIIQACIYASMHRTNEEIERAYVDMSPRPGSPIAAFTPLDVVIGIKNYGRTPANVVAAALDARITDEPLPDAFPTIQPKEDVRFWIQPNDTINWSPDYDLTEPLSREIIQDLIDKQKVCWIIGWVDYVDRFKKSTRHRFTRRYDPANKRFVVENKPGYNGDHNPND